MKKAVRRRFPTKPGEPPTPRQIEVLGYVLRFFAEHGFAPTLLDLAKLDGRDLPTALSSQIRALADKGRLVLPTDGRGRGIQVPELRDATKALAATMERAKLKTVPRTGGEPIQPGDPPTPLQGRMYKLLLNFFARNGYPPTLRELTEEAEESSTSVVVAHLRGLHKRGFVVVNRSPKGARKSRNIEVPKLRDATKALAARMLKELA
jgi:SOS-response transcriptional repressor LexA